MIALRKKLALKLGAEYEKLTFKTRAIDTLYTSYSSYFTGVTRSKVINNSDAQSQMTILKIPVGLEYYFKNQQKIFYGINFNWLKIIVDAIVIRSKHIRHQ